MHGEIHDGVDRDRVDALQAEIARLPDVLSVAYVSKEQALADYRAVLEAEGRDDLTDETEINPLPAYLLIVLGNGAGLDAVQAALAAEPEVISAVVPHRPKDPLEMDLPLAGLGLDDQEIIAAFGDDITPRCHSMPSGPLDARDSVQVYCGDLVINLAGLAGEGLTNISSVIVMVERPIDELVVRQDLLEAVLTITAPPDAKAWLRDLVEAGPQPYQGFERDLIVGGHYFGDVHVAFGTPFSAPEAYEFELLWVRGVAD